MRKENNIRSAKGFLVTPFAALFCAAFLWGDALWAAELRVYVPGGLKNPMEECAKAFPNVEVIVVAGRESSWMEEAAKKADIIAIGAAHLYSYFAIQYPDVVSTDAWFGLYQRPVGILVRKGNPKNIQGLKDLASPGLHLLNVACSGQVAAWEDIAGKNGLTGALLKNFAVTVPSGFIGMKMWKENPGLDAWLTFASWHYTQKDETDLIEIPDEHNVLRSTMAAVTVHCRDKEAAARFVAFLKSEKAHAIFRKWGWR